MSTQAEDVIMKAIMELFQGDAVRFFGINKRIVSAARTELTHLELKKNIDDWVFEAEDSSFLHFEFQTTLKEDDLKRFMVSDAILCYKEGKPVKTVVVYSGDIEKAKTSLDFDSIKYKVDAFYLAKLDGDGEYRRLCKKIEEGGKLKKRDLISIVFLPLMKNSVDRDTRLAQSVNLSKEIKDKGEQLQIQAMVTLLAEKFITDKEIIKKLKGELNMMMVLEVWKEEVRKEVKEEVKEEVIAEVKAEMKAEVKEEMKAEVKAEMKAAVKEEMKAEVKEEVKAEVKEEVKAEVKEEVKAETCKERDIAIAQNALKKGAEIDFIRDITGLATETIKQLQAELNSQ